MVKKKLLALILSVAVLGFGAVPASVALAIDPKVIDAIVTTPIITDKIIIPPVLLGNPKGILRWEVRADMMMFFAPALGPDNTIYVAASEKYGFTNKLLAYKPDGTVKWQLQLDGGYERFAPAFGADGTIYVTSEKKLFAVNPDGTPKWQAALPVLGTPAIGADGTIYTAGENDTLYAIAPDGTVKWKFAMDVYSSTSLTTVSSPVIGSDGTIYIGTKAKKLFAVKPNGVKKWELATGDAILASPAIGAKGDIFVGSKDGKLSAVSPEGGLRWEFATGTAGSIAPVVGGDGTVYVGAADNKLYAINASGTKWSVALDSAVGYAPALGSDGTVYAATNKKLYALGADGQVKWEYDIDYALAAPFVGTDGTVYVGAYAGKLYALGTVAASSVTLDKSAITLQAGGSAALTATVVPDAATNKKLAWSSSNSQIAAVDSSGNVTGVAAGTAKITATTDDGGFIAVCDVTVTAAAATPRPTPTPPSTSPPASPVTPTPPPPPAIAFSDTAGHWAEVAIKRAVELGVVSGYPDGTFKPDGNVTRAEFAVMLIGALKPRGEGVPLAFTDAGDIGAWAVPAVAQAVKLDIINGYPDGTYRPAANISHAEMMVMVARAAKLPIDAGAKTTFADDADIPDWAKGAVAAVAQLGIASYVRDNVFAPYALSTRAESATTIVNLLQANK